MKKMDGLESAPGAEVTIDGKRCLYFGGTSYFCLHSHPEVIRAGVTAFQRFGTHSATTRAGFGNNPVLLQVEDRLKDYFDAPDAAYFGSGYLSRLVLAQALSPDVDVLFVDEAAHFCVNDAALTAQKPVFLFRHRNPDDLRKKLNRNLKPRQRPLVLSDGVFPTFGLIAPLPEYLKVLEPCGGLIGLDDAHGAGVLGPNGRGTYEHFGLSSGRRPVAATLSKAFGGHGGFVTGTRSLVSRVRTAIGAYVGSTPTPTPIAAASAKGIEILKTHPEMRQKLRHNIRTLKAGLRKLGIQTDETPVPIAAWSSGSETEMKKVQRELLRRNIAVAYLKYVGAPSAGVLRLTIFSTHTEAQIHRLLEELGRLL
jgi:8-amino-7-oxononanoate synthase